ncbi:hypothetical protein chiPu_0020163 [Chiloscyllium punctatum]|uniref:Uncharacterized protein n=1 Tax=Chiloscyllium punctatum TaxID=137246 RepID=A0A401RU59_CHIPU|nr:hypothetical protein [Chiloscyllium punctatum]
MFFDTRRQERVKRTDPLAETIQRGRAFLGAAIWRRVQSPSMFSDSTREGSAVTEMRSSLVVQSSERKSKAFAPIPTAVGCHVRQCTRPPPQAAAERLRF